MRMRHRYQVSFNHKESDAELIDFLYGASQETKRSIIRAGYALLFGNKESQSARAAGIDPEMMGVLLAALSGHAGAPHQPGMPGQPAQDPRQPYWHPGQQPYYAGNGGWPPQHPYPSSPPAPQEQFQRDSSPAPKAPGDDGHSGAPLSSEPEVRESAAPEASSAPTVETTDTRPSGPSVTIRRPSSLPSKPAPEISASDKMMGGEPPILTMDSSQESDVEPSLPEDDLPDPLAIMSRF